MRIEVENLTPAGEPFAHTYGEGELSLDETRARLAGETSVAGRASRKGREVRLAGKISARFEMLCDRCLRPVEVPAEVEFEESFVPREDDARTEAERELLLEDLHLSVYDGDAIEVGDLVREQLLLALPARFVCRDDCKGLCPHCGTDLNAEACDCADKQIDPRWAALGKLKE